ncbi:DUF6602 domain-containing protein [Chitinimonas sp. JJ19]|uniref:DUF6602 domain-containing protein n=1 Tax=Chitinimonas sp. JJ19 TaxID=3109352 RepID=UPI003001134D
MEGSFGQRGWKEFHRNRKNILAEYDKIIEQTSSRPVRSAHGPGIEAYIRKWLSDFLPKKYGVTSGYIIPNVFNDNGYIYHFDIIIYNQLEAPILWIEGNEDNSDQGKSKAIPAQHVIAVYEVKSRLTKANAHDALEKLKQTEEFKEQLNEKYSCGIIFTELKETENKSTSILQELYKGKDVLGFKGGMVLRYEGDETCTGLISLSLLNPQNLDHKNTYLPLAKRIDDLNFFLTEDGNLQIAESGGGGMMVCTSPNSWAFSKSYGTNFTESSIMLDLSWSRSNFSRFCMNLLASLEGMNPGLNHPFFGMIFDSIRRERASPQPEIPRQGYPFLTISLHQEENRTEQHSVCFLEDGIEIEFLVEIENKGDSLATISDDEFRTTLPLPAGKKGVCRKKIRAAPLKNLEEGLAFYANSIEFPYRLVYKTGKDNNEFFAVEATVKICDGQMSISSVAV